MGIWPLTKITTTWGSVVPRIMSLNHNSSRRWHCRSWSSGECKSVSCRWLRAGPTPTWTSPLRISQQTQRYPIDSHNSTPAATWVEWQQQTVEVNRWAPTFKRAVTETWTRPTSPNGHPTLIIIINIPATNRRAAAPLLSCTTPSIPTSLKEEPEVTQWTPPHLHPLQIAINNNSPSHCSSTIPATIPCTPQWPSALQWIKRRRISLAKSCDSSRMLYFHAWYN